MEPYEELVPWRYRDRRGIVHDVLDIVLTDHYTQRCDGTIVSSVLRVADQTTCLRCIALGDE